MIRLKLKEPCDRVFIGASLVNPSTGESITVDAKIDTGAVVSVFPMSMVSNMGLEVIGERDFVVANGSILHAYVVECTISFSDDDAFDMPLHICNSHTDTGLIGMDILSQCNYSQWHEWKNNEHSINFMLETAQEP